MFIKSNFAGSRNILKKCQFRKYEFDGTSIYPKGLKRTPKGPKYFNLNPYVINFLITEKSKHLTYEGG